ncbi:MAG: protein-arginine deiminase family protein, partial [Pseudomonadota bacterium]
MAPLSIFGDFDQDGRISRRVDEQDLRTLFPGLILLPNIDADRRRKLPRAVSPGKPVSLDHEGARSGADDEGARIVVRVSDTTACHLHFEISDGLAPFVAMTDARRRTLRRNGDVFKAAIRGAGDHTFRLETITTRGSPMIGIASQAPTFTVTAAAFDADGAELETDSIVATIAPWLIHDNLSPPARLYICDIAEDEPIDRGNLPSVTEVGGIVRALRGVAFVRIPKEVNNGDAWIQDQYQVGYCEAPRTHVDVIAHLPRLRSNISENSLSANLSAMVHSHFPSANLGVLKDFYERKLGKAGSQTGTKTILYRDSFELSRLMDRMWNLWGMARRFYFKSDVTKTVRNRSLEKDFRMLSVMDYFEARSKLPSVVNRTRRVLDRRADKEVAEGQRDLLQQQRALLSKHMSLVHKTVILRARTREIRIPTKAFGPLIFTQQQIDDFDTNMIGKHDSMNFGGNLEVSPPLKDAPLGKIAFGANLSNQARSADPDLVSFLEGQSAQPVVDIDTAWLDVAHVDEVMAFVPAPSLSANAAIAVASPGLGMAIINAAFAVYMEGGGTMAVAAGNDENQVHPALRDRTIDGDAPITQMLRGRYWLHQVPPDAFTTVEPPTIYLDMARHYPVNFHLLQDGSEVIALNHEPGQDRYYNASLSIRELRYFGAF